MGKVSAVGLENCGGSRATRPIRLPRDSVNQRFPSGPTVIPLGRDPAVNPPKWVTVPSIVIRPILSMPGSVNHIAPSGPAMMPAGSAFSGSAYSVTAPPELPVVIAPIMSVVGSTNQTRPSGPGVIVVGSAKPAFFQERRPLYVREGPPNKTGTTGGPLIPVTPAVTEVSGPGVVPTGTPPKPAELRVAVPPLERGCVYEGGNLHDFERFLNTTGDCVFYVDNHIYNNILHSKKKNT